MYRIEVAYLKTVKMVYTCEVLQFSAKQTTVINLEKLNTRNQYFKLIGGGVGLHSKVKLDS